MKPIVTIGICAKNAEAFINHTIKCIEDQDFPQEQMEIIFVDDGSDDRTFSIIKNAIANMSIDARVFHQEWKGVGPARNVVVNHARGKYIVWIDADQRVSKDYIRTHAQFMEQNAKIGICYGNINVPSTGTSALMLDMIHRIILWKYADKPQIGTGGSTYRLQAIKEVGGFDNNLTRVAEDADASVRIQNAGWSVDKAGGRLYESHNNMSTWKDLWDRNFRHGYNMYDIYRVKRTLFSLPRMNPLAGFMWGLLNLNIAYKTFYRKIVFLLPLHSLFKLSAWCAGFIKKQFEGRQ